MEACRILKEKHPDLATRIGIVVVGNRADQIRALFPFPVYAIDYVSDEKQMARLYNAVDAYVTPSLEDNLPNTIVEALSLSLIHIYIPLKLKIWLCFANGDLMLTF